VCGIDFSVGVFTNLTQDHLDFHGTMGEYGNAKLRLFPMCEAVAANLDDEFSREVTAAAKGRVSTFSAGNDEADLVAKRIKLFADRVEFCALSIGVLQKVELGIPGMFSVYNALAAIAATAFLGVSPQEAADALRECAGVKGRAEIVPSDGDFTILIDYAHTPDAMENILRAARQGTRGRLVTLFGCGGDRDRDKRSKMGSAAAGLSDFVVVTTDNPRTEEPGAIIADILDGMRDAATPYKVIDNREEAITWAVENSMPGDVLILAGKGHETYQILGGEKIHFDEREIVARALAASKVD
jgi:UDP-N-acetylmuramoyl-L-alanyl-D-glutamate--2,6-diaminopimelate ligase